MTEVTPNLPHLGNFCKYCFMGTLLSVTPGNFDTPMGQLESAEAQTFTAHSALKRNGRPEEIAALYALLLDERLGYLTGTDIVMDGGVIASGISGLSR